MDRTLSLTLFIFLLSYLGYGQLGQVQHLPEVILTDASLIHFSKGYKVEKIPDSLVEKTSLSLTETLRRNSAIYFKENGLGMVSSPSFRGTNAAQTAVIWNGININSVFTGQTDFNTISPQGNNDISIRSGGGAVQYGSGAVGGSVHLQNTFSFNEENQMQLGILGGSFGTTGGNFSITRTWEDHYLNVGVDFVASENDYEYVGKNKKNEHGEFLRFQAYVNEARRLKHGMASWNSEYSYNNRNFSGSLNTVGRDAYHDINTRNLWRVQQQHGLFNTTVKFAHLFEQFRYFPDSHKPLYSQGSAHTFLGGIQSEVFLMKKFRLQAKMEYSVVDAQGENIGEHNRKTFSSVLMLNHKISRNFGYGISLRKDFEEQFDDPLLFAVDARWSISPEYALRLNASKNYRVPTFNDLYWYAGGNVLLKPETSYQVEVGQELNIKNLTLDLAAFYIFSDNLIKWIPASGSLWKPSNISQTENRGMEAMAKYVLPLGKKEQVEVSALYSFTQAEDSSTHYQLIYVPLHKGNAVFTYRDNKLSVFGEIVYTGRVYTATDNSESVSAHTVFNLGAEFGFLDNPKITAGGKIGNLFNRYYENVAYRPMPSRNIQLFLHFNI